METTHTFLNPVDEARFDRQVRAAAKLSSHMNQTSNLDDASWVRVFPTEDRLVFEALNPVPDPWGLWCTKVAEGAQPGYVASRVFVPWASIARVIVLAVHDPDMQPF